jgi:hypothetical protein
MKRSAVVRRGAVLAIVLVSYTMIVLDISRLSASTSYLAGIALPMVLLGAGQGGALGPLTAAGIAGVDEHDAGAAGGVTQVAHQIGGSLGLGILVAVFAAADPHQLHGPDLLAHRISVAFTVGAGMLALAVLAALVSRRRSVQPVAVPSESGARHALLHQASGADSESYA